jgi:phage gp36-like protein
MVEVKDVPNADSAATSLGSKKSTKRVPLKKIPFSLAIKLCRINRYTLQLKKTTSKEFERRRGTPDALLADRRVA